MLQRELTIWRLSHTQQIGHRYFCTYWKLKTADHYSDVIMGAVAYQITSLTIVYPTVYLGADQRIHQISASLTFVRGIPRWLVNSPHKGLVRRKMFPFCDVIMTCGSATRIFRRNQVNNKDTPQESLCQYYGCRWPLHRQAISSRVILM